MRVKKAVYPTKSGSQKSEGPGLPALFMYGGAINFNNMIPIHPSCLTAVDMKILETDSKAEQDYKNLLANQLSWCNANKTGILVRAEKLYNMIVTNQVWPELARRCCDFTIDEAQYRKYCTTHGLEIPES